MPKNKAAVELGHLGGSKGGPARAKNLSKKRIKEIASMGGIARAQKAKLKKEQSDQIKP